MVRWNIMGWIAGLLFVLSACAGAVEDSRSVALIVFISFAAADIIKAIDKLGRPTYVTDINDDFASNTGKSGIRSTVGDGRGEDE